MRPLICIVLAVVLGSCAGAHPNSIVGVFSVKARSDMDDRKCQEFGYKKPSEGYAKCRLNLEQGRAVSLTGTNISVNTKP